MADLRSRSPWRLSATGDDGFSLIEVMVTVSVLLVGVLGTVSLIDGANATTQDNRARQAATALSREMVEAVRSIPYQQLTATGVPTALQTRAALADSSPAAGYTIVRRGTTYTVTVDACSLDDAKDGLGSRDAGVTFCADSAGPADPSKDRNTDDYRRVAITVMWTRSNTRTEKNRQTTLVTNPVGGLGPNVKNLTGPTSISTDTVTTAQYTVETSTTPASFEWSVNGDAKGTLAPTSTNFTFDWPVGNYLDGTYLLHAEASDSQGRAGSARVLTVTLNRKPPLGVAGFAGGRNGNGSHVDLEWRANGEGDVVGYRAYRTDSGGAHVERVCPPAASSDLFLNATSCVDQNAPASGTLYYRVYAIDTPPAGGTREGDATSVISTVEGNTRPTTPTGLTACSGGVVGCNGPDGATAPAATTVLSWTAATDPDGGDSVSFYRIYRDGTTYDKRLDRLYSGGPLVYVDANPGGTAHDYRVSAVDTRFGESPLSAAVNK